MTKAMPAGGLGKLGEGVVAGGQASGLTSHQEELAGPIKRIIRPQIFGTCFTKGREIWLLDGIYLILNSFVEIILLFSSSLSTA